jgi:DNA-binding CsgD family transcriptional regulator
MDESKMDSALLDLYMQAQELDIEQFCELGLRALNQFIPFDSAIVAEGQILPNGDVKPASMHMHNQPIEKWIDYQRVKHLDVAIEAANANLGHSISYPTNRVPNTKKYSELRDYAKRFEVSHALVTISPTVTASNNKVHSLRAVSLWRASEKNGYSARDQLVLSKALPHFMRARGLNQQWALAAVPIASELATLVCTANGYLLASDKVAFELLVKEWAQWTPPWLPSELMAVFFRTKSMIYHGKTIVAKARNLGSHLIINMEPAHSITGLTPAESIVARLAARPMSYKELADHLGVATSTVRNQLHSVYEKLNLKGKAGLAALMVKIDTNKPSEPSV